MARSIVMGGKEYIIVADAAFTRGEVNKAKARYVKLKDMQVRRE